MARKRSIGSAVNTSITSSITSSDTTATLADATGWPTAPFVMTLDQGLSTEEKVLVGARSGTGLSDLTRGYDNTTAVAHTSGASAKHTISAIGIDEADAFVWEGGTWTVAPATKILGFRETGDSVDSMRILSDGKLEWGSGSGATDTNLYRSAADTLKTDDAFVALAGITGGNFTPATNDGYGVGTSALRFSTGYINSLNVGLSDVTGTRKLGIVSDSASAIGVIIKGAAAQSANLQEWQNSAGTVLALLDPAGMFRTHQIRGTNNTTPVIYLDNAGEILVVAQTATDGPLKLRGAASQSANLQEWQDSTGTVLARVGPAGYFEVKGGGNAFAGTTGWLNVKSGDTTSPTLAVEGVASQTAKLQQWQNSAGTVLASITAAGLIKWDAAGNQQTTVGAAGGASALPATPTKYLKVVDSAGTTLVIPAYAAA